MKCRLHPPNRPPWQRTTPSAPPGGNFHLSRDGVRAVLHADEDVFRHARYPFVNRQRRASGHQVRPPGSRGVEAVAGAVVDRQYVVADRFFAEERLQFLELLRFLRRQIASQAEVVRDIVKLPLVVLKCRARNTFPTCSMNSAGEPTVMVNGAVADRATFSALGLAVECPITGIVLRPPRRIASNRWTSTPYRTRRATNPEHGLRRHQ